MAGYEVTGVLKVLVIVVYQPGGQFVSLDAQCPNTFACLSLEVILNTCQLLNTCKLQTDSVTNCCKLHDCCITLPGLEACTLSSSAGAGCEGSVATCMTHAQEPLLPAHQLHKP